MCAARLSRMFPLSGVLFPGGIQALNVFEPRYLSMISDALEDDGRFGVVLIERGSEVGGGDVRFDVGTGVQIARGGFVGEDRMAILGVGTDRIRVVEWLEDDPYPRAMIVDHPGAGTAGDLSFPIEAAKRSWRRLVALASELGAQVGDADLELPADPVAAIWALCSVSSLEQIDRQRLLETDDPRERADRLRRMLDDQAELLEARLAGGFG